MLCNDIELTRFADEDEWAEEIEMEEVEDEEAAMDARGKEIPRSKSSCFERLVTIHTYRINFY